MLEGLNLSNAMIGILTALTTAVAGVIGIYIKSTRDRGDSRETRYEEGMWKTIDMLTAKVDALEKARTEQNTAIDALRSKNFEIQQQYYSTQNQLSTASGNLERSTRDLADTQALLKIAQETLALGRSELSNIKTERDNLQENINQLKERQIELLSQMEYWKMRAAPVGHDENPLVSDTHTTNPVETTEAQHDERNEKVEYTTTIANSTPTEPKG